MSGSVSAGQECRIPLGGDEWLHLSENDLPQQTDMSTRTRVVMDAYIRYRKTEKTHLMFGGGTSAQPKAFWEMDNLFDMIKSESEKFKKEVEGRNGN